MSWSVERLISRRGLLTGAGVVAFAWAAAAVSNVEAEILTGGPHFYETAEIASGGPTPIVPKGKLTEAQAKKRTIYGVAVYDLNGRLASYEAIKEGRRFWMSKLAYSPAGRLESETYIGPKGGIVLWKYDDEGRFVHSKMIKGPDS